MNKNSFFWLRWNKMVCRRRPPLCTWAKISCYICELAWMDALFVTFWIPNISFRFAMKIDVCCCLRECSWCRCRRCLRISHFLWMHSHKISLLCIRVHFILCCSVTISLFTSKAVAFIWFCANFIRQLDAGVCEWTSVTVFLFHRRVSPFYTVFYVEKNIATGIVYTLRHASEIFY